MRRANRKGYGQTMIIRKKHILFTAFTILITCFTVILVQAKVSAYDYKQGENSVIDKIVNKNAHTATKSFKESIELLDLIDHGAKYLISDDDGCTVPMPNTIINGSGDHSPTLSCYEFFVGKGNEWSGIMDFPKFESNVTTPQTIANYVRGFGYTENSLGSTEAKVETKCLYAIVENGSGGGSGSSTEKYNTDQVCVDIYPVTKHLGSPRSDITSEDSSRDIDITYDDVGGNEFKITYGKEGNSGFFSFEVDNDEQGLLDITWADFVNKWKDLAKKISYAQVTIVEDDSLVDHETVFYKGTSAAIVGEILGTPYASPLSTAEVYNIYNQYLNDDSNVTLKCSDTFDFKNDKNNEWYQVKVKRDGKIDNTCWATDVQKSNSMLYTGANPVASSYNPQTGQDSSAGQYYFTRENMRLKDIVNQINGFDLETILNDISDADASDWSYTAPNSQPNGDNVTCMNSAGTSLGWILCPVLDAFGGATKWVYNDLVEPALQIEPQLFTGKGDGTQDAWRTFRDIANIFFIILFLVVIFSQLTGVGIDNYGIKKILPKLIIVAVLINLSYIICLVFVDLSNIFGNGLRSIFTDLGSRLTVPSSIEGVEVSTGSGILTFIAVLMALIVGVGVAISASGGLVAFLVSLLAVALSAIVALFFLFLLLAAREAAIVVLTVLSPLAFACYILPNTQNIFKKWYQLGWRLLLVYPIAGLLIGGGDYVSKLLLSSGVAKEGFFSAFVAMIAGIVPIFFIPTVLKQSFALMGGLGAKLSGLGRSIGGRMSGNLDKSIRGSERFKNYQADRERNRKLGFARRTNERLTNRQNNGRPLNDRQRRLLASARMAESAEYAEDLKRNAIVDGSRYEAMRAGIRAKDQDQAINDRLALMQSSGIMVGGQRSAYTLDNLSARMRELETASRSRALSSDEQSEMAALARGMVSQKGGAGMLNNIVRDAGRQENGSQTLNSNFMSSLGQIYNDDSAVAGKMVEKDGGMGGYMEKFMPGGAGGDSFDSYLADTGDGGYAANAAKRIKSHEAGLNQSGEAFKHYLGTLDKNQTQAIMDNPTLLNSLDTDNRAQFMEYAKNTHGITQATPRQVEIAGENQVFDVHSLDDDTLLDIATNPNISDNDPNRRAAVEELGKRNIK